MQATGNTASINPLCGLLKPGMACWQLRQAHRLELQEQPCVIHSFVDDRFSDWGPLTNSLSGRKNRSLASCADVTPILTELPMRRSPTPVSVPTHRRRRLLRSQPSKSRPISNASHRRAGPRHKSRVLFIPRRCSISCVPCTGSTARTRTAEAAPFDSVTMLKHCRA